MDTKPTDYPGAVVLGFQEDGAGGGFWLYNLTVEIPGHPVGSTVAERTIREFNAHAEKPTACGIRVS